MDLNRLTQKSQEALHDAQTKALRFGHTEVEVAGAAVRLARDGDSERAVRQLREVAGNRACLEAIRDYFVARLHRRQDDYDATRGLQLVIRALQQTPFTNGELPYPRPDDAAKRRWVPWGRR